MASRSNNSKPSTSRARSANRKSIPGQQLLSPPQSRYFNRDESWLLFNRRVLEEADDITNPLLERLKFLAITSSNLDEFLEIRVAGMLQQLEEDTGLPQKRDEDGFTPAERLDRLAQQLHRFHDDQAQLWNERLSPALLKEGICIVRWKRLTAAERAFATKYFQEQVDPLLTPVTLDP